MNLARLSRVPPIVLGIAAILVLGASIAVAGVLSTALPSGHPTTAQPSPKPEGSEAPGAPRSAQRIQDIVSRLAAAGITTTAGDFSTLAGKYGVGGAVRILAFAHAAGKTPAEIAAMFDGGKGWGQIRKELNISINPGIGWILGNGNAGGNKPDKANKNANKSGSDDDGDDGAEPSESPEASESPGA